MAILLSDAGRHRHLLPLTFTRPVGALRAGILTQAEGWARRTGMPVGFRTEAYLAERFPGVVANVVREVDAALLPTPDLVDAVLDLEPGRMLVKDGRVLAFCEPPGAEPSTLDWGAPPVFLEAVDFPEEVIALARPWHLFQHCGTAIANDFALLTEARRSQPLSATNTVVGDPKLVFLEEGAQAEAAVFNTTNGPIYLGKGSEVMEGCLVRGPLALGDGAQLKLGAKIYGPCSFGPACRVGGEVNNSVLLGYSNKGHDGFLGNSVLGEWCNLGADTNTSNLKNTYGPVKVWSYAEVGLADSGLTFCGMIMGDHAKAGINTMFNTGTVVGVCANVFGGDFPPKHVPGFSWGGAHGLADHDLDKALETARRVMARRNVELTAADEAILRTIHAGGAGPL